MLDNSELCIDRRESGGWIDGRMYYSRIALGLVTDFDYWNDSY